MLTDHLTLDRPLVSLDLETTGIDIKTDRIVQIVLCKVSVEGNVTEWETLVNPGVPIPKEASDVHGITDERVLACQLCKYPKEAHGLDATLDETGKCAGFKPVPSFRAIAPMLARGLDGCDLLGYNLGSFDVKLLAKEFNRVGIAWTPGRIVDGFKIFQRMFPRNLTAAVREYLQTDLVGAHGALVDARAALLVVEAQMQRHGELPRTVQGLHDMFFVEPRDSNSLDPDGKIVWRNGEACIGFGKKHNGKTLREVKAADPGFLKDFILKGDFNAVVQQIAREALEGRFPEKKT